MVYRHRVAVQESPKILGRGLGGSADRGLQVLDQVDPFPREQVAFRLAAEMAVGGGRGVDRLVEAEVGADAARGQAAELVDPPIASSSLSSPTVPVPCVST